MIRKLFFPTLLLCLFTHPALATGAGTGKTATEIKLTYSVYFGGLRVINIDTEARLTGDPADTVSYELKTRGISAGFLDLLFPFESLSYASGQIVDQAVTDANLDVVSVYSGEERETEMRTRSGVIDPAYRITPPIPVEERDPVPPELLKGALDPVASAFLNGIKATASEACDGKMAVFNGKSRNDIFASYAGSDTLAKSSYSAWEGPTEVCYLSYATLVGAYKKSWFGSDKPTDVKVWFARPGDLPLWLPVRAETTNSAFDVIIHLEAWSSGSDSSRGDKSS